MNEQQRLSYLRSMGYQVYYPRAILPGAKPSPTYDLGDTPVEKPVDSDPAKTARSIAKSDVADKQVLREAKIAKVSQSKKATTTPKSKPDAVDSPATETNVEPVQIEQANDSLQFSLQYFAINDRLAVINEEPHQLRGKQQKDSLALLRAILQAVDPELDIELKAEQFDWPLAEGLSDTEPEKAAQLALQGFINQRQSQEGFSNLIFFTAQLGGLLNPQGKDKPLGEVAESSLQCQLTITHSLHSMLVVPLLKKEVWSHLQPVRARLQNK